MAQMIKLGRRVTQGSVWDEGGKSDIVQILISHQPDYIKSIQFLYNSNGVGSLSEVHGEHTGTKFNTIVLDHAAEFLTSVSGEYNSMGRVVSIVFGTNKNKYGPFGRLTGGELSLGSEEFNYEFGPKCGNMQKCCFGGFHGSLLNGSLNSIGVYVKPLEVRKAEDLLEDYWYSD